MAGIMINAFAAFTPAEASRVDRQYLECSLSSEDSARFILLSRLRSEQIRFRKIEDGTRSLRMNNGGGNEFKGCALEVSMIRLGNRE